MDTPASKKPRRANWLRRIGIALAVAPLLAWGLLFFVEWSAGRALLAKSSEALNMEASAGKIRVSLVGGKLEGTDLRFESLDEPAQPLASIRSFNASFNPGGILQGRLSGEADVDGLNVHFLRTEEGGRNFPSGNQNNPGESDEKPKPPRGESQHEDPESPPVTIRRSHLLESRVIFENRDPKEDVGRAVLSVESIEIAPAFPLSEISLELRGLDLTVSNGHGERPILKVPKLLFEGGENSGRFRIERLEVQQPEWTIDYDDDGDSNMELMEEILEALFEEEEDEEKNGKHRRAENSKDDSREERESSFPSGAVAINEGSLAIGTWRGGEIHEHVFSPISLKSFEEAGSRTTTLRVGGANRTPMLDLELTGTVFEADDLPASGTLRLETSGFPLHPFLWQDEEPEDDEVSSRVYRVLLDARIGATWNKDGLLAHNRILFREIDARADARSLVRRMREEGDDWNKGNWGTILAELAPLQGGDSEEIRFALEVGPESVQPLIVWSIWNREFTLARQRAAARRHVSEDDQ